MKANYIKAALDVTVATLQGGVERLGNAAALSEIEAWERKLEDSGSPELAPIAENLGALRTLLSEDDFDPAALGRLMVTLGDQVQRVANSDVQIEVADKLSQLSVLLSSEGDSLSSESGSGTADIR